MLAMRNGSDVTVWSIDGVLFLSQSLVAVISPILAPCSEVAAC
jgi:hypothetical protein